MRCDAFAILFSAPSFDGRLRRRVNSASSPFVFQRPGRNDIVVEKEQAVLKVLQRFLPEPLTDEEIRPAIPTAIRESGAAGCKILGKVSKE